MASQTPRTDSAIFESCVEYWAASSGSRAIASTVRAHIAIRRDSRATLNFRLHRRLRALLRWFELIRFSLHLVFRAARANRVVFGR